MKLDNGISKEDYRWCHKCKTIMYLEETVVAPIKPYCKHPGVPRNKWPWDLKEHEFVYVLPTFYGWVLVHRTNRFQKEEFRRVKVGAGWGPGSL